jgi:hypothetical protein
MSGFCRLCKREGVADWAVKQGLIEPGIRLPIVCKPFTYHGQDMREAFLCGGSGVTRYDRGGLPDCAIRKRYMVEGPIK